MPFSNIDKPNSYFNTVLYTGNGTARSITGVGFQPDLVWGKQRTGGTNYHIFNDAVRGVPKNLYSNATDAEDTLSYLTSLDTDGFTVSSSTALNGSGSTYVAWNFKANGTGVSNTAGTITSTVSANTTSGFSIVSYTGTGANATIGHGLGVVPKMIIVKNRSTTDDWTVQHVSTGATQYLALNRTDASASASSPWNNTTPTSSLFSVGTYSGTNGSSNNMIAYCFAEVKGYSKFGSYTGNGSTDGTFIYTGFSPAFVMIKETSGVGAWRIYDSKRGQGGDNIGGNYKNALMANVSDVEESGATNNIIDSLSNGFKCRYSFDDTNGSGGSYIYMAFANSPFVSSKGIPTTAR